MDVTNEKLKQALSDMPNMGNKKLTETILGLKHEHDVIKANLIELMGLLSEIEYVYEEGYSELNSRLYFETKEPELTNE